MLTQSKSTFYITLFIICWCVTFSLMKGWGEVHEWANVSWLINYDFGFIKRGLWGSIVNYLTPSTLFITPEYMEKAGLPVLFLLITSLLAIAVRTLYLTNMNWVFFVFILTFFTSPFITMLANIRNYLDIPISLFGITALFFAVRRYNIIAMLLLSISVFIHELTIVIFLPLLVLLFTLQHMNKGIKPLCFFSASLTVIIPLSCLVIIIINQQLLDIGILRSQLENHLQLMLPMAEHRARLYSEMLTYSFISYLQEESLLFKSRISNPHFLFTIGLFPLVTLLLSWHLLKHITFKQRLLLMLIIAGCCIAPLTLHLIAFDTSRIWTMPILSCFISLWLILEISPKKLLDEPIFPGLLLLCTWIVYWLIEPIVMFNAEVIWYQSDFLQAASIPVIFVCFYISRSSFFTQVR